MPKLARLLASLGLALTLPVTGIAQDTAGVTAPLTDAEREALTPARAQIELGRSVAEKACAECHGMDGAGGEAGQPHLAGQRTVYLHRVLQAYQDRQRRNDDMYHATGFLNDEALLAVSAYYASLAPVLPATPAESDDPAGGDPFAEIQDDMKKCVKCHGAEGNASGSGMPNLTAQDPEYFVSSMQAYGQGARNHKLMQKLVGDLEDSSLALMGLYYAVQEPQKSATTGDGDPQRGAGLAEACSSCHGADGNAGSADMPTLAGQDARYFGKAMKAYQSGAREHQKMFEAVESLQESEIADLAAFYATQQPVRRNVRMPLTTGEWMERCERCHGIDGNSTDPRFPMLAGQDESYLAAALRAYASNERGNSLMHAMADPLSAADVARLARHYATRTPKSVVYMQLPCEDGGEAK